MAKHRRPQDEAPDLFTAAAPRGSQTDASPVAAKPEPQRRYILPRDLAGALTRLTAKELDDLAKAVTGELRRRHPGTAIEPSQRDAPAPKPRTQARKKTTPRTPGSDRPHLTQSRINAIRAAIKAGIKPTVIARQFGVSQAAIREVLSEKAD